MTSFLDKDKLLVIERVSRIYVIPNSAITIFIRNNISLLLKKEFSWDYYDEEKKKFFEKYNVETENEPKDQRIAEDALFYLIRKRYIKDETKFYEILTLPFFKTIRSPKRFLHALESISESSTSEDNTDLNIQSIDEEQTQEKTEESTKPIELQEPTEKIEEPDVIRKKESPKREWWEILDLVGDPFPLEDGLKRIKKSLYEDIIVRTDIFNNFLYLIENHPDQLFRKFMLYGEYGSGKTTFFDYLDESLLPKNILLLYVQLWASPDSETIIHRFHQELLRILKDECKHYNAHVEESSDKDYTFSISECLTALHSQSGFKGFIIVIDDLHKNPNAFNAVLDFLSYLQIFTSRLSSRTAYGLGLYIAGIPQWRDAIQKEKRLSGSLDNAEQMPDITEADAYEMLNNRMQAYQRNPHKKDIIGAGFVSNVHASLRDANIPITFREFVRKAVEEFRKGNFDSVLIVNPTRIPADKITSIWNVLRIKPRLNVRFEALVTRLSKAEPENRQRCFQLLATIYIQEGVLRKSPQYERNAWAYAQLESVV